MRVEHHSSHITHLELNIIEIIQAATANSSDTTVCVRQISLCLDASVSSFKAGIENLCMIPIILVCVAILLTFETS